MSIDIRELIPTFYERVNSGDLSVMDEVIAEDFVEHEEFPGIEPNKEGVKQFFSMFRAAFPDLRMEVHEVVTEGDLTCARFTMTGTHEGEFMGIPATGKKVAVPGFDMLRLRDGKVTEHWGTTDGMVLMQQLGVIPEQAPA